MGRKGTDSRFWESRVAEVDKKGPGYRGFNQVGNSVFVWMREMRIAKRFLKKIMVAAIIFDILLLLFEFRTIQFGAFCLGLKTSEIVYERTVQVTPK